MEEAAAELDVPLVPTLEDAARSADVVISCVWPDTALHVARASAVVLARAQIFADVNNVGPKTTEAMFRSFPPTGAAFIKLAIMGGIAESGWAAPMLAGGARAAELAEHLGMLGMDVTPLGTDPVKPAAIKIIRAGVLKAFVAGLEEALAAARRYGVEQEVMSSAAAWIDSRPFLDLARMWLDSNQEHAERRARELDEVIETLEAAGVSAAMARAAQKVFRESTGGDRRNRVEARSIEAR